jgi:hypothetical protein
MSVYIYSTLSTDTAYATFSGGNGTELVKTSSVLIEGKANIANRKTLVTPKGVLTTITDAEYASIKDDYVFNLHIKNGFIQVETKKTDAENVAKNMTPKDKSSQKTKEDFKNTKAKIKD